MTITDWTFYLSMEAAKWLNTAVYLVGLGIAVWAFLRCRKRGYLVLALFFALVVFSWHVWPAISQAIHNYRTPAETRLTYDAAVQKAINQVLAQEGHPPVSYGINIEVAPIVLVFGLWLLAKREPEYHRPNKSLQPTATAPSVLTET